ncbi:MAG TPA: AI-2E family transporter [Myxococcota bacterium]|jgi:AI-2 transport protein TqsA|nr:AI-2E family transporter [Myxococcota bacterium]
MDPTGQGKGADDARLPADAPGAPAPEGTQPPPPPDPDTPAASPLASVPSTVTGPLLILAALAIGYALHFMRPVLVPLVLAVLISYLVSPLVDWLQVRLRLPRAVGILAALLVTGMLFVGVAGLISASVRTLAVKGPQYQKRIVLLMDYGSDVAVEWGRRLSLAFQDPAVRDGDAVPAVAPAPGSGAAPERPAPRDRSRRGEADAAAPTPVAAAAHPDASPGDVAEGGVLREWVSNLPFADLLLRLLNNVALWAGNLLLVLVFVVYLVGGRTPTTHKSGIWREIDTRVKRYILVKFATSALTGVLVAGILSILGLDLAVVFGVLAFLLNFIPSVGSIIATLLPLPVALVQYDTTMMVVLVLLIPGTVQLTIGNLIEPKIMGSALSLHPITVLLALVFWGILWGIAGMLLAAPITAVLKIVLDRVPGAHPIARLLEGELPGAADART